MSDTLTDDAISRLVLVLESLAYDQFGLANMYAVVFLEAIRKAQTPEERRAAVCTYVLARVRDEHSMYRQEPLREWVCVKDAVEQWCQQEGI